MTQPGSSEATAIPRPGARVVLLDASARVLLLRSEFDDRVLWFTPGGALAPGESFEAAALRELREEVGLSDVTLGPWIWERHATWYWETRSTWFNTTERFYLLRLSADAPDTRLNTTPGAEDIVTLTEARWWSLDELREAPEGVSPSTLRDLLAPLVRGDVPVEPVQVGL